MPWRPRSHAGRTRRVQRAAVDEARGSAAARGYGYRWQKASKLFLRCNPLCRICERAGVVTAAVCVDHIIPHRGDERLFWDQANWQPACKQCHDKKTAREDGGFGH